MQKKKATKKTPEKTKKTPTTSKSKSLAKNKKNASPKPSAKSTRGQNPVRLKSGRIPLGRTLSTKDKYIDPKAKDPDKKRPVIIIETNFDGDLAVVQLTTQNGKDRTKLKHYQKGKSYYKHYVEIEDDKKNPIRINDKFHENQPELDVSLKDVEKIRKTVFEQSKPSSENRKKIEKFRNKKRPRN